MIRTHSRIALGILLAAACCSAQQLVFTPYHATGIYDVGDTVGWTVTPGPVEPVNAYRWTIRRNNAVVLKEGKLDLSPGSDRIEIRGDEPEMLYVAIEPVAKMADGGNTGATTDCTRSGPRLRPRRLAWRRSGRPTSTHSGPRSLPRRPRFRSILS